MTGESMPVEKFRLQRDSETRNPLDLDNILMVMTGIIMAVGIFLPMGPLAHAFKLQALPSLYFMFLPVMVLAYMGLTQAVKGFYIRRFGWA